MKLENIEISYSKIEWNIMKFIHKESKSDFDTHIYIE